MIGFTASIGISRSHIKPFQEVLNELPGIGLRSKDFQRTDSAIPCLCHPPNATLPFFPGKVLLPTCYQTLSESLGLFQTPRGIRSWCMCRILPCSIVILEPTDALLNIMSSGGTLSWKSYWASDCAIHPWRQGDLATTACARWRSTPTSLLEKQFLRVPRSWWIFPIKIFPLDQSWCLGRSHQISYKLQRRSRSSTFQIAVSVGFASSSLSAWQLMHGLIGVPSATRSFEASSLWFWGFLEEHQNELTIQYSFLKSNVFVQFASPSLIRGVAYRGLSYSQPPHQNQGVILWSALSERSYFNYSTYLVSLNSQPFLVN